MSQDRMKVEISFKISHSEGSSWEPREAISYTQDFTIPVSGFAQVAEVLGKVNDAMAAIKDDNIHDRLNAAYRNACAKYGAQSTTAQALEPFIDS